MNLLEERKRIEKMLREKIDNLFVFLFLYFLYFLCGVEFYI